MRHRRSIRAVFRVQCGKCLGWLSLPKRYTPGTDIYHADLIVEPSAERAGMWPGERAARTAARNNGWRPPDAWNGPSDGVLLCPVCKDNPLAIVLPPDPDSERTC